ncbi:hypothetical protein [Nocardiopsis sp. NRRL B-16309]|uniref:hypothetical protein n=1 Tax=Nocardiopsis sp. NRRL B-16309 TaxID=1519494 RepID=UPI0018CFFAD3|nr:hypothetical protein [Nocardiopsis sp. NRRL B-16309]
MPAPLRACDQAASAASQVAFATGATHKYALQERAYTALKVEHGLPAQPAVRVIGKVADAYSTRTSHLKKGLPGRRGRHGG